MTQTELTTFWSQRPVKIWVVNLIGLGKKPQSDKLIVRAKTKEGALKCAKFNSIHFRTKKCSGTARFADPVADLHCVQHPANRSAA